MYLPAGRGSRTEHSCRLWYHTEATGMASYRIPWDHTVTSYHGVIPRGITRCGTGRGRTIPVLFVCEQACNRLFYNPARHLAISVCTHVRVQQTAPGLLERAVANPRRRLRGHRLAARRTAQKGRPQGRVEGLGLGTLRLDKPGRGDAFE